MDTQNSLEAEAERIQKQIEERVQISDVMGARVAHWHAAGKPESERMARGAYERNVAEVAGLKVERWVLLLARVEAYGLDLHHLEFARRLAETGRITNDVAVTA